MRHDVVAMLAVSLDGFIAEADGGVGFLDDAPVEGFDFEAFAAEVGAVVTGRATYEQALGFGWAYGDTPTLVLTSRDDVPVPDGGDVRFSSEPTGAAIRRLASETEGRLWVLGGGRVVTDGLRAGAIDTLDLMVVPVALGTGIPLFTAPYDGPLRLIEATPYGDGARLVYDVRPTATR